MSEGRSIVVRIAQRRDYQLDTDFGGGMPVLRGDEPPPLGRGEGPEPVQLLATAVGNCLLSSLLFALRKYKQAPEPLAAEVSAEVGRNEQGRLRVRHITARLKLGVAGAALQHLERALASFESFCTVTESVRAAIPVTVEVFDAQGVRLK